MPQKQPALEDSGGVKEGLGGPRMDRKPQMPLSVLVPDPVAGSGISGMDE
jgi:hypothetical protein